MKGVATDLSTWQLMELGWVKWRADDKKSKHFLLAGAPAYIGGIAFVLPPDDAEKRRQIDKFLGRLGARPGVTAAWRAQGRPGSDDLYSTATSARPRAGAVCPIRRRSRDAKTRRERLEAEPALRDVDHGADGHAYHVVQEARGADLEDELDRAKRRLGGAGAVQRLAGGDATRRLARGGDGRCLGPQRPGALLHGQEPRGAKHLPLAVMVEVCGRGERREVAAAGEQPGRRVEGARVDLAVDVPHVETLVNGAHRRDPEAVPVGARQRRAGVEGVGCRRNAGDGHVRRQQGVEREPQPPRFERRRRGPSPPVPAE